MRPLNFIAMGRAMALQPDSLDEARRAYQEALRLRPAFVRCMSACIKEGSAVLRKAVRRDGNYLIDTPHRDLGL